MNTILTKTISFYDNAESFYHGFAMGLFNAGASGLDIVSNRESGNGRPDIIILDHAGKRGLVLELKHAGTPDMLEDAMREALDQIEGFRYTAGLPSGIASVNAYGIAFSKKTCMVRRLEA